MDDLLQRVQAAGLLNGRRRPQRIRDLDASGCLVLAAVFKEASHSHTKVVQDHSLKPKCWDARVKTNFEGGDGDTCWPNWREDRPFFLASAASLAKGNEGGLYAGALRADRPAALISFRYA